MKHIFNGRGGNYDQDDDDQSFMSRREERPSYLRTGLITFALCEIAIMITALSLVGEGKFSRFNQAQSEFYQDHQGVSQFSAVAFCGATFFVLCALSGLAINKIKRYLEDNVEIEHVGDLGLTTESSSLQLSRHSANHSANVADSNQKLKQKRSKSGDSNYLTLGSQKSDAEDDESNSQMTFSECRHWCFQIARCCSFSPNLSALLLAGVSMGTILVGTGLGGVTWSDFVNSEAHLDLTKFVTVPISLGGFAMAGHCLIYKVKSNCSSFAKEESWNLDPDPDQDQNDQDQENSIGMTS